MQRAVSSWKSRAGRVGVLVLAGCLGGACSVLAQTTVTTFVLESVATKARTGPFECRQGVPVDAGGATFILGCPNETQVEFVDVGTARRYGPYDFVEGRIVTIGRAVYTLVDFGRTASSAVIPAIPPRAVVQPPVFEPSPEPVATPKPATPAVPQPTIAPTRRTPVTPTRPQPPSQPRPARRRRGPFYVSADIGLLDHEAYEWSVDGASGADDATIERTAIALRAAGRRLGAEIGFVYQAEIDATIEDAERFFYHGEASDGTGWWIGLSGDWPVWERRGWQIDVGASARYRMEDYSLTYDAYQDTVIEVATTNAAADTSETVDGETDGGTNEVAQTTESITVWQYVLTGEDMTLSEASLYGRTRLIYESPAGLQAYVGLRVLAYSRTDIDATVRGHVGEFDLEFERTGVVSALLGISREFAGMRWHADGVVGSDTRLTVGLTREF